MEIAEELLYKRISEKVIKLGKGIEYEINCEMLDFRPVKLENKIQYLIKNGA